MRCGLSLSVFLRVGLAIESLEFELFDYLTFNWLHCDFLGLRKTCLPLILSAGAFWVRHPASLNQVRIDPQLMHPIATGMIADRELCLRACRRQSQNDSLT